jgi:hypothetical protein
MGSKLCVDTSRNNNNKRNSAAADCKITSRLCSNTSNKRNPAPATAATATAATVRGFLLSCV